MLSRNINNNITHERPSEYIPSSHHISTIISLLIFTYSWLQRHPVTCKPQVQSRLDTVQQDRRDRMSTGQRTGWNPHHSQRDPLPNLYLHGTSAEEQANNMHTTATGPQRRRTTTIDDAVISNLASVSEQAGGRARSLSNVTTRSGGGMRPTVPTTLRSSGIAAQ
jgi:hypothetical protein